MKEYIFFEGQKFTIEWYYDERGRSQPKEFFEALSEKQRDKLYSIAAMVSNTEAILSKSKFRNEGDKIYAFKPQPERFLCFFFAGGKIIITNGFVKKQRKLPENEKERALKCMKSYISRNKEGTYYAE